MGYYYGPSWLLTTARDERDEHDALLFSSVLSFVFCLLYSVFCSRRALHSEWAIGLCSNGADPLPTQSRTGRWPPSQPRFAEERLDRRGQQ